MIVSTYIDNHMIIKNKKFDMRIYVAVTSFNPLRVYMYDEGLARFATEDYSNDPNILKNKFVHLTNFSINKRNIKNYVKNDNRGASGRPTTSVDRDGDDADNNEEDPEQESSSKWSLKFLRRYLSKNLNNPKKAKDLFQSCKDVIIKTLICAEPKMVEEMSKCGNR